MRLSVVWRQTIPSLFITSLMEPSSMPFREVLINNHFRKEPFFFFFFFGEVISKKSLSVAVHMLDI